MNTVLIILTVVLACATVYLYLKYRELSDSNADYKDTIREKNTAIALKNDQLFSRDTKVSQQVTYITELEGIIKDTEKDLLKKIHFKTPEGTIAINVKVKTLTTPEGKIIRVLPTIRRKVGDLYKEIPVTLHYSK